MSRLTKRARRELGLKEMNSALEHAKMSFDVPLLEAIRWHSEPLPILHHLAEAKKMDAATMLQHLIFIYELEALVEGWKTLGFEVEIERRNDGGGDE